MTENSVDKLWKIWESVLKRTREVIQNDRVIDIWFKPLKINKIENNVIYLEIPNQLFYKGLEPFLDRFKDILAETLGFLPELRWVLPEGTITSSSESSEIKERMLGESLNPDYIFETFVVGPCNRLAHAASLAVAQSPGMAYNPLFIYGDVGLGKTHLMQAIGHLVGRSVQHANIAYMPCEIFMNQFIHSIQTKTAHLFRNKFRKADVLLIDDIHFLAGKEGTQEEFFHTFNALYDQRKQIVLSSDRPPKEIADLEKRLVSRFEWGLVVDLQPPDFETRVAILKKKCETKNIVLGDDVIFYLAENISGNIRLLEGALNRLVALSSLFDQKLDINVAKEYLKEMLVSQKRLITIQKIQEVVAEYFRISIYDLKSQRRVKNLVIPRQIAMHLAREMTASSLTAIAEEFGGKDHTTVIHACKKIKSAIEQDANIRSIINRITDILNSK
ncbi:MAG TPA: chromosomal replication initiator protein DnaA [bacterium]|nr:chromosomal replication initiator protein DnaA [bacterium]HOL34981.1 chromosomal replication initiator protein DnaA [bacterium]HPP08393.1 chromosomal replication initiator protein DnaA [bacterium]